MRPGEHVLEGHRRVAGDERGAADLLVALEHFDRAGRGARRGVDADRQHDVTGVGDRAGGRQRRGGVLRLDRRHRCHDTLTVGACPVQRARRLAQATLGVRAVHGRNTEDHRASTRGNLVRHHRGLTRGVGRTVRQRVALAGAGTPVASEQRVDRVVALRHLDITRHREPVRRVDERTALGVGRQHRVRRGVDVDDAVARAVAGVHGAREQPVGDRGVERLVGASDDRTSGVDERLHGQTTGRAGGRGERGADPEHVDRVEDGRVGVDPRTGELRQVVEAELGERLPVLLVADVADVEVRQTLGGVVVEGLEVGLGGFGDGDVELGGGLGHGVTVLVGDDHGAVLEHRHRDVVLEQCVDRGEVGDTGDVEGQVAVRRHRGVRGRLGDRHGRRDGRVGVVPDLVDGRAPQVAEAPRRDVVHRRHLLRDVLAEVEQRVGEPPLDLVQVDDVRAGRVGGAPDGGGRRQLVNLDLVEQQLLHEPGGVVGGPLVVAGRDHVGARQAHRLLVVSDVPERLPLRRAGNARDVGGGHLHLGRALEAPLEHLGLVGQHLASVGRVGHVLDHAGDGLERDGAVDHGVGRALAAVAAVAAEGQLDRRRGGAVVSRVLRGEDRREVVPAGRRVAVRQDDLSRVGGGRSPGGRVAVGVAGDVRGRDVLLHLERDRVVVGQVQVVLVVRAVRRSAGLDLEHAGVAVEVGAVDRLDRLRGAHERARLGEDVGDHVAVLVEPEARRPRRDRAAVRVERQREVQAVVAQDAADL